MAGVENRPGTSSEAAAAIPPGVSVLDPEQVSAQLKAIGHFKLTTGMRMRIVVKLMEEGSEFPHFQDMGAVQIAEPLDVKISSLAYISEGNPPNTSKGIGYDIGFSLKPDDSSQTPASLARAFLSREPYAELKEGIDLRIVQAVDFHTNFPEMLSQKEKERLFP